MRPTALLGSAWLIHAVAWLCPVMKDGVTLPEGVPGWQAFRVGLAPIWPYEGVEYDVWYQAVLPVLSSLTNLLMLGSPLILTLRFGRFARVFAWAAAAAFLVDAHWYVMNDYEEDLRIGYFLWTGSFLLLSTGMFIIGRSRRKSAGAAEQGVGADERRLG